MKKKTLLLFVIFGLFCFALFFSFKAYNKALNSIKEQFILSQKKKRWLNLQKTLQNRAARFKGEIGLVVKDLDTGWCICLNENELFPSASLVKIPVMLSFFYAAQEGRVDLKEEIRVKPSQIVSGSKLMGNFRSGGNFVTQDLFDPMITLSDNTATNVLIDRMGFETLNLYFKKIGLKNTNIARNMMDFKSRSAGRENYTSAYDMAYILEKLYRKQFLTPQVSQKCLILLSQQKVNDRIPKRLPKEEILTAHKTGLERHICHDVGIVYTQKGNFLICVLVKHRDKFAYEAKKLISDMAWSVYNYY